MSTEVNIKNRVNGKLIFFSFIMILVLSVLSTMPRILFPLLFSYIMAMVLRPLMFPLKKLKLGKTFSIIMIFIGLGFFIIYPIVKAVPLVQKESDNLQYYLPKLETVINSSYSKVQIYVKEVINVELPSDAIEKMMITGRNSLKDIVLNVPNVVAAILEWLFIVPLFLFFFLRDGEAFKKLFLKFVPNQIFERGYYLFYQFNIQIGDYIFAKVIEATIVGLVIMTGLFFMDIRFAILLGLLAGVTNIIPYLGPVLGIVPALLVAFVDHGIGAELGAVAILYTIANVIDLAFVFPILVSKIVDLHPIIVVVSVILGSQYFGVFGMIVSIPVAASLKLLFSEIYKDMNPPSIRG